MVQLEVVIMVLIGKLVMVWSLDSMIIVPAEVSDGAGGDSNSLSAGGDGEEAVMIVEVMTRRQ